METSSCGFSATRGSSSRSKSRASSTAMLRDRFACRAQLHNTGTSFLDLARLQRRHRVCRLDSSVLPPLLTGII